MSRLFLLFFFYFLSVFAKPPTVTTSHGQLTGKVMKTLYENKEYYAFMGIPYARPPVGELKFLPPRDLDPWNETLIATKEKPACMQFNNNIKKQQPLGQYGDEDCLYLDIFTPNTDENKRAVIVFIYSERLYNSYNKTRDYAPDFFLEEDVVVVTPSHRLGIFGFLSFEDDVLPGNSGLLDLHIALKWISKNIERFGGDPKRVTLMGSQGGATAVDLLIRSKAKKLFNSAILQSGTSFTSMYLQEKVRERALKLGDLLGIPSKNSNNLLRELRGSNNADFFKQELRSMPDDYNKDMQRSLLPFGPIIEKNPDGLITKYPENATDEYNIPLMIGFNSREGIELSLNYLLEPNYVGSLNKYFPIILPKRVDFRFDPIDDTYFKAADEIKKVYFKKKKLSPKSVPEFITYIGDVINAYAINEMVQNYAKKNSVYYYHFDYYSNLNQNKNNLLKLSKVNDGTWGAALGDELCYLLKCPELSQEYLKHKGEKSEEWTKQQKLIKIWTTFAKYGYPNIADNDADLEWPTYNEKSKKYLSFGHEVKIKENILSERFQFWNDFIKKWKKRAINGVVTSRNKKDELYFCNFIY